MVTHQVVGVWVEGAPKDFVSEHLPRIGAHMTSDALGRADTALSKQFPKYKLMVATDGPDSWRALWLRRGDRFSFVAITEEWTERNLVPLVKVVDEMAAEELPPGLRHGAGEAIVHRDWASFDELVNGLKALASVMATPPTIVALVEADKLRYLATIDRKSGLKLDPVKWSVKGDDMHAMALKLFGYDAKLPDFPFGTFQVVPRRPRPTGKQAPPHDANRPLTTGTANNRIRHIELQLNAAAPREKVLPVVIAALDDVANQGEAWATVREALYRRVARLVSNDEINSLFGAAICKEPESFDEVFVKIAPTAALQALAKKGIKELPKPIATRVTAILAKRKVALPA